MSQTGFWDDQARANKQMQELKSLKNVVEPFNDCCKRVADAREFLALASQDEGMLRQISAEIEILKSQIDTLEMQAILSGRKFINSMLWPGWVRTRPCRKKTL